jgi:hypothetical protein
LIPGRLSPQINAALASVRYETNNGYGYLWRILKLTVPGFDPVVPIQIPVWSEIKDIFKFAQAYLLYFRLQGKMNFHYDDRTRSGIFLRAIQYTEFADAVTTLQSHVNSYREGIDDHYLPPHLRLHGLATSIHQHSQARIRDIITLRIRHLGAQYDPVQGPPTINRLGRDDHGRDAHDTRDSRFRHDNRSRFTPTRDDGYQRGTADTPRQRDGYGADAAPRRPNPRGQGRLVRPTRNRRPYFPDVQCAACKRVGHVAKHCDMLATAICIDRYLKNELSAAVRDTIEWKWLDRWRKELGNPDQTPRQVLRAYVEDLDITVAQLDASMDWECWDVSDTLDSDRDE